MSWAPTFSVRISDGRALVCAAAFLGCAHPGEPVARAADVSAIEPLVAASTMSEADVAALENRCGVVADVADDPASGVLFRLDDCAIARPRYGAPYAGDAGLMNCQVRPLYPGHKFADPARYSPEAILRLVAPLKGKIVCVVGSYQGLGQFYFYGLLPQERKHRVTLR